jgi:hypothetical protein
VVEIIASYWPRQTPGAWPPTDRDRPVAAS